MRAIGTMFCNHLFVDGFGGMGDALVCTKCGLYAYPESIAIAYGIALVQGRVIRETHPQYREFVKEAQDARNRYPGNN